MYIATLLAIVSVASTAAAQFQVVYPPPRGPAAANDDFYCDRLPDPSFPRTVFPLSGGFFTMTTDQSQWLLGVDVVWPKAPNSLNDLSDPRGPGWEDRRVREFALGVGAGSFCIPLPLSNTFVPVVQNGANLTLKFTFDSGFGRRFQCADVVLSNTATNPSNVQCINGTSPSTTPVTTPVGTNGNPGIVTGGGTGVGTGVGTGAGTTGRGTGRGGTNALGSAAFSNVMVSVPLVAIAAVLSGVVVGLV